MPRWWTAAIAVALAVSLVAPRLHAAEPPAKEESRFDDLVKALKSKNAAVRKQAALALGDLGEKARAAVPALREALLDADENVQAAAAQALEKVGPAKADAPRPSLKTGEAEVLEKLLKEKDDKLAELTRVNDKLKTDLVATKTEMELLRKRAVLLEERVRELEKAASGRAAEKPAGANPPPNKVEGKVKEVEDASGLITITIGSDAGLEKDHTLEVYRLEPAKYLGRVRVVEVKPASAVVKFDGKPLGKVEKGDQVASAIDKP